MALIYIGINLQVNKQLCNIFDIRHTYLLPPPPQIWASHDEYTKSMLKNVGEKTKQIELVVKRLPQK